MLIVVLSVLALYAQTLAFPWIHLDDYKHVFENPLMIDPSWEHFWRFWKEPFFTLYIPFTYTIWFVVGLFSHSTWIYHLINILFHTASVILVFLILRTFFKKEFPSLIGALFFGLHPIQVESVVWISGLKDCLFGFLVLLALYLYKLHLLKKRQISLAVIYSLMILALLSKPTAVITPFLFLCFRRIHLKESWKVSLRAIAGFLIVMVPIAVITKSVQPDLQVKDLAPLWFRPVVALHAIGFYLKQVLVPFDFILDYGKSPRWLMQNLRNEVYFVLFTIGLVYIVYRLRVYKPVLISFILILIPLLPVTGLIPFQFQLFSTVADRYFYLSMFGVGFGVCAIASQFDCTKSYAGVTVLIAMLGTFTHHQVTHWQDNERLFTHTIEANPASFLARNNLAYVLFEKQRFEEAAEQLKKVTELRPEETDLFINYSSALMKSGQEGRAASVLRDVLRQHPDHSQARRLLNLIDPKS